jgi:hypothetical protein
MNPIRDGVREITRVFTSSVDKRDAHQRVRPILEQISREPEFLRAALARHLTRKGVLATKHYPVVSIPVALTPHFELVLNCWIPLPGGNTNLSTKAVHHHGAMLLSTATVFGPGYEHWTFSAPRAIDAARGLYTMDLLEAAPHPLHHVAFVDARIAHLPMYPSSLTITLALWSNSKPTTWVDHVKHMPLLKRNEQVLKRAAMRLGLQRQLDLKVVEYYDFFPTDDGFVGMKERQEFARGPNEDYLYSLVHILQTTGNAWLGPAVRRAMKKWPRGVAVDTLETLISRMEKGILVEGRLSPGHYDLPHANFTRERIKGALRALSSIKESHVGRFTATPSA